MVTDMEAPWQNAVEERHGALFKMAFEKACSLGAPTTEAEVDELIDFTFVELNRRVGVRDSHLVNESSAANFDSLQACSRTTSSTPTLSLKTPATRGAEARPCGWQLHTDASSPPIAERYPRTQSTAKTTAGIGGWRARLHSQTEGRSPRMVRTWRVRLEWRTEAWTELDSLGARAELFAHM